MEKTILSDVEMVQAKQGYASYILNTTPIEKPMSFDDYIIQTFTVYKVQSYLVKFDMGNPVDVNVNVYIENATLLSKEEILAETFGHLADVGITDISENQLYEIEVLERK